MCNPQRGGDPQLWGLEYQGLINIAPGSLAPYSPKSGSEPPHIMTPNWALEVTKD